MLLDITPLLKANIDDLAEENEVLDCKKLRTKISEDESSMPEYDDVQEIRICNNESDDIHIDECVANAICDFYNKENGITKSFEELIEYLNKRDMLLEYFRNVKSIEHISEIAFKYLGKTNFTKNVHLNRPRAFKINNGELYIIQPDRRKPMFISMPGKTTILLGERVYVN